MKYLIAALLALGTIALITIMSLVASFIAGYLNIDDNYIVTCAIGLFLFWTFLREKELKEAQETGGGNDE